MIDNFSNTNNIVHSSINNPIIINSELNNKNNLNNSNIYFYDESQVAVQLELLKDKLKMKDYEFEQIIKSQKLEYERLIRERDEEVTGMVEHLISENQELKRQIIDLEIELEQCKETVIEYKKNYEINFGDDLCTANNNIVNNLNRTENLNLSNLKKTQILNINNLSNINNNTNNLSFMGNQDKYLMESIRLMKSNNDISQKEINDKYNLIIQNMIYDNKVTIENLKRINIDTKNKILQDRDQLQKYIPIKNLEDQISVFENKIKSLFEDLKNKEKYISISENKYQILNEENIYIKNRLSEEKKFLLMKINEIKKEHEETHGKIIQNIQKDINEKKTTLQAKVEESLKVNEDIIKSIVNEKESILGENKNLKKKVESLNKEIEEIIELKKRSDENIIKIDEESRIVLENKKLWSEEYAKFNIEKNTILKINDEMLKKINEYKAKIFSLENIIKQKEITEEPKKIEFDKILKEYENKYKNQIEKLNTQIIDLERKLKQFSFDFEGDDNKVFLLEKKIREDRAIYESTLLENDKLKAELNEEKVKVKLLNQSLDEKNRNFEKIKAANYNLDLNTVQKDEIIKDLNEKLTILESEKNSNKEEIERLIKLKAELIEESKINKFLKFVDKLKKP